MALTHQQIGIVKGMLRRGDKQHDIAAYFGVNGGRIAEIATEQKGAEIPEATPDALPPAGSYSEWLCEVARIPPYVLQKIAVMCEKFGSAWLVELVEEAELEKANA